MHLANLISISARRRAVEPTSHESSVRPNLGNTLQQHQNHLCPEHGGARPSSVALSSYPCDPTQSFAARLRPSEMPKESVRRVRKGTRSCQECRHRKVKCEWAGDDASTCNNCLARSRTCVAQAPVSPVSEVAQLSSRHRIRQLEDQVGSLWNVVHTLQASAQHDTDRVSQHASAEQPYYTSRKTALDQSRDASSRALEEHPASGEAPNDDSRASSDTDDSEPDSFNLLPSNQPNHLRQLFDNDLLDAQGSRDASWQTCDYTGNQSASKTYLTLARRQLQKILPPRDDLPL
jgi:hypothetical protein